jgi:dolichyl-diphosphooligosaccharide---protein glycosyltransferase
MKKEFDKSIKFLVKNKHYIQWIIIFLILIMSFSIRYQGSDALEVSEGEFLPQALDSYYFMRLTENLQDPGQLPEIDQMRNYPIGVATGPLFNTLPYINIIIHSFLNIFSNSDLSFAIIISPILGLLLTTIFLFLFVRRILGWKTALVSAFLLNITTTLLHRTNIGFADHDIWGMAFLFLILYFFIVAYQHKNFKYKILFGILAGIASVFGLITGGNVKIAIILIGFFGTIKLIFDKYKKEDLYLISSYFLSLFIFGLIIGIWNPITKGTLFGKEGAILTIVLIGYLSQYFINKYKKIEGLCKKTRLPNGFLSIIISIIILIILGSIFLGPERIFSTLGNIFSSIFHTFSSSRHATTVSENQPLAFLNLINQIGAIFFIALIGGSIVLMKKATEKIKQSKLITIAYSVFIIAFTIILMMSTSISSNAIKVLSYIVLIAFALSLLYGYFRLFYKNKEGFNQLKQISYQKILLLAFFLIMLTAVSSAARLMFEFTPIMIILVSFFFVWAITKTWQLNKGKLALWWVKGTLLIIVILIIFLPIAMPWGGVTTHIKDISNSAKYVSPGLNPQWQLAGEWAEEGLQEDAVLAHWWDYGYWVQSAFERPTVTDGGNQINFWNYLMGRDVLTAPTLDIPLKFLKTHEATHLLIVADEIPKYGAYSLIGSNEDLDRQSHIPIFGINDQATQYTRENTILIYSGNFGLDEDFIYNKKVYAKNQAGIVAIKIPIQGELTQELQLNKIQQPSVLLSTQTEQQELKLQCLYIGESEIVYPEYDIEGCFRILPTWDGGQNSNNLGAGLFLSKRTYNTLLSKLYILNQESEYYTEVYNDKTQMPFLIYQGRLIGPMKIWELNYPTTLSLTEEEKEFYLAKSFTEAGLKDRE